MMSKLSHEPPSSYLFPGHGAAQCDTARCSEARRRSMRAKTKTLGLGISLRTWEFHAWD